MDQSQERGHPIIHTEPWAKLAVVILDRHVAYLDRLAIDIRLKHGLPISRDEVMRALIEWALANVDPASLDEFLVRFAGTFGKSE